MTFTSVEAEGGALAGGATVEALTLPPPDSSSSPALEASGHAYVQLNATGQSVTLTNNTGHLVTALNVRYSIPDAPTGGGITNTLDLLVDGVFRQAITLNSSQTWCYQTSGSQHGRSQDPTYGQPHIFYDETHFFISGPAVAPGSTITFQQDAANTAAFYWLDVVDMDNPPGALSQPANSLCITNSPYNAVPNNISSNSASAIQKCINDAQSQHKSVWVPPGVYYLNSASASLSANDITLEGAGMWYSTIYANPVLPASSANILFPTSCTVRNLAFDANARSGGSGDGNGGGLNVKGNNWLIDGVWVQHLGAGIWADGSHGIVMNSRTSSTWADGINLNNGNGAVNNNIGNFLTASNCFVRGSGDDGLALNSGNSAGCVQMTNTTVINCTSVAPWWANNLGIYGGVNILVSNNLCMDSVGAYGISAGEFGNSGLPLQSGTVVSNTIVRGGSYGFYGQNGVPALNVGTSDPIDSVLVAWNTINNAVFMAMGVEKCDTNVTIQYNTINAPRLDGIDVAADAVGTALIYANTVTGLNPGKAAFANSSSVIKVITPTAATNYSSMSGVATEACAEGGLDVGSVDPGDWMAYNAVNLTGANTFEARVASANGGGNIEIHLDSAAGALAGTCPVPGTGGAQTYVNAFCKVSGASGIHTVYLVCTGVGSSLFSVEYFALYAARPALSHQLVPGNVYSLKALVNGKYVTAASGGASALIASSAAVTTAEQFKVIDAGGGNIGLQSLVNSNYVCADNNGTSPLIANRTSVGSWETFTELDAGNGNIGLRAMNDNEYVSAANGGASALIAQSATIGTTESFTVGFVTGVAPPTPSGLAAAAGNLQASLGWNSALGATGYNIKRSTVSGGSYGVVATNLPTTSCTDTGLLNGTTYYYVVSALNPAGESTNSPQVSATPGALNRSGWVATASSTESGGSPANAIDGNISTRWSTGVSQANGEWFMVDMGTVNTFYELILDAASSSGDYPRGYLVNVSCDGVNWGSPVATGSGFLDVDDCRITLQAARYIRVTQTGSTSGWWSIHEFNVLGAGVATTPLQLGLGVNAGQLVLDWPTDHMGWRLQAQTNSINAGLGTNWVTVSGSAGTNQILIPLGMTNGSVLFRLVYP